MNYLTNDLIIDLPHDDTLRDMSTNVLQLHKSGITLGIGRGFIDEGGNLKSTVENQLSTLKQQGYECEEFIETTATDKNITAYENQVKIIQNDILVNQLQLHFQIPDTNRMLSVSFSKFNAVFTDQDKTYWQKIKNRLTFQK